MDLSLFTSFVNGLFSVFTWPTFGFLLVGIAIGFVVGILPGLGGAVTLALMLPFTFEMRPLEAFAFLLGMLSVTATTGDITSILFGVPGEGLSAALVLDGHPMAKQGQAGRALGAALMSSLIGAVIGAFALAASIPIIRPLVLAFGSPEFFMLTIVGITFMASISGGAVLKGLIAGGLGLLLATVGMDPQSGVARFTFGQLHLWDGVGLVPVAIGLFGIPELVDLAMRGTSIAEGRLGKLGGVLEGVKDTFRHFWLVVRCSLVGLFCGIIPGLGGGVGQWLAYGHAVQTSPDKNRFGKGAVEGVLGPGAANNSKEGGNLIPTIAFGVPSTVVMAILLGAFLIQGLVPGPAMLTRHLDLTMSFVWLVVISNLITVVVCFLFIRQIALITYIRGGLLIAPIILLIFIGAFAVKNAMLDVVVTLFFGLLALVMNKLGWPRPPLILGLVLGRLTENYLFRSFEAYGFEFLTRPIVVGLIICATAAVVGPLLQSRLRRGTPSPADVTAATYQPAGPVTGGRADLVFALVLLLFVGLAIWDARIWDLRARLFPWAIGIPLVGLLALQFGLALKSRSSSRSSDRLSEQPALDPDARRRGLVILGWMFAFAGSVWLFSFLYGGTLATLAYLRLSAREKWPISLAISGGMLVFLWVLKNVLHVPFPDGVVFEFLGS